MTTVSFFTPNVTLWLHYFLICPHIISHMAILSYNLQKSVYLPVCDFLIVDSAQQYRVKQFNLIVCVELLFFYVCTY